MAGANFIAPHCFALRSKAWGQAKARGRKKRLLSPFSLKLSTTGKLQMHSTLLAVLLCVP